MSVNDDSTSSGWSSTTELDDIDAAAYPPQAERPGFPQLEGYVAEEEASDLAPNGPDETPSSAIMTARAYQLEMLQESLRGNIIVAMDTGSGKTQVAVLRITAELDRSAQRIWYIAPTVVLVDQQLLTIQQQIPSVISKRICGEDNVETWSTREIWDAFLENVRIVVSTPDVLADALKHNFVRITTLSLIVFDEAHNCKGGNAGARIMREFYRPAKEKGLRVPHILGLTASPVVGSSQSDLDILESTLDSRCRAPKRHREELFTHVKIPEMSIACYGAPETASRAGATPSMTNLFRVSNGMDITRDPTILRLQARRTERSQRELRERLEKSSTPTFDTMHKLCRSSIAILEKLGPWAADFYIHRVVSDMLSNDAQAQSYSDDDRFLESVLRTVDAPPPSSMVTSVSRRMDRLIQILSSSEGDLTGIIFAEERATVVVMTQLLLQHPTIRGRFKVAAVVGTSQSDKRRRRYLELNKGDAQDALHKFRRGKVNLLVATTVLEEGIDVPACNLVICFEKPKTLKSFIQRRGRARMSSSRLILLLDDRSTAEANEWREMELEMKRKYEDESRRIQIVQEVEEAGHLDYPPLEVEAEDGALARLTLQDAKPHLEHFCATLSSRKFVDFSPFYTIQTVGDEDDPLSPSALFKATVHLPVSLPPGLRKADSLHAWPSEQNAKKDAAFQAYQALHAAGLVNNHLLPLKESDIFHDVETRESEAIVREQLDPWPGVAKAWQERKPLNRRVLMISDAAGTQVAEFDLILPVSIPQLSELTLYWDADTPWTVQMGHEQDRADSSPVWPPPNHMQNLIDLAYGHRGARYSAKDRTHILCLRSRTFPLSDHGTGGEAFDRSLFEARPTDRLVRDTANHNHPYIYTYLLPSKPPAEQIRKPSDKHDLLPEDVPYVVVSSWPKKTFHFHRPAPIWRPPSTKPYHRVLPVTTVEVDTVPSVYARAAMCLPALISALEVYFVASELQTLRLEQLQLSNLEMVATAICAPSARKATNYERLETLGDCVLKLAAVGNSLAHHPNWPEGLLSVMKDALVSNSRLAKAAVDFGLDRYIIKAELKQDKWTPPFVEDHLRTLPIVEGKRKMSTKTLADVVEALVGVSYIDGGLPKALECIALFIPAGNWRGLDATRAALLDASPKDVRLPPAMEPLEQLLGYSFRHKALLVEAVTHSSYRVPDTHACLERLEFLGDAVLDYLVMRRLFAACHPVTGRRLAHWEMHLHKTAIVNKDFLAFRAMEWSVAVAGKDVAVVADEHGDGPAVVVEAEPTRLPLWSFLRHSSTELALAQRAAERRHAELRGEIDRALREGERHPWAQLARLQAQKYYSDVFESVLGAVYVDSDGSFEECDRLLERSGLMASLDRILGGGVKMWHPKEELGKLAVSERVEYEVDVRVAEDEETREFTCRVRVGDKVVAEVGDGVSREEVKTRAAEVAIRYYEQLGGRF